MSAAAIAQIVWTIGWGGGRLPAYVDGAPAPSFYVKTAEAFAERCARLDLRDSAEVALGLPMRPAQTILWAWVRGSEQERRAYRFRHKPSIVLKMGRSSERLLIWGLREPTPAVLVESANVKLSYALHAPRTRASIDKLRIPMPGTFLRRGRTKPVPILVTRLELGEYQRDTLVGRLKDPPPADAWKDRKAR